MAAERNKLRNNLLWAASALLALAFVGSGGMKILNPKFSGEMFVRYGYPAWFAVVIGVAEVAAGLLLLVPRLAAYAAGALAVIMAGAVFTHLRAGEAAQSIVPFVLLVVAVLIALARRRV